MANNWQDYQKEVAAFFQSLGLEAETDANLQGVRTSHAIDVVVRSRHAGFTITWIVECKHWSRPISKLHVLGLREIVADLGVDRGILVSESGFQSGAIEAAKLTNVHVNSLATLRDQSELELSAMRLRELFDRVEICRKRYWDISKGVRIDCGLRPESMGYGYSGDRIINLATELLTKSFRGVYPLNVDSLVSIAEFVEPRVFSGASQVISYVESVISELELKLDTCRWTP
ncbi:MAG: restriction endonuclease [Acidobacteriaceae bacterium]|nr:restriction endonuclease [Acidobacteriaceae bacterium]